MAGPTSSSSAFRLYEESNVSQLNTSTLSAVLFTESNSRIDSSLRPLEPELAPVSSLGEDLHEGISKQVPSTFDRLYFDDPADENERFDKNGSEWHEMLSAPLFTNSVLECIKRQIDPGTPKFTTYAYR